MVSLFPGTGHPLHRHHCRGVILLALGLLALALWASPRHIQAGDAGEFATVMLAGGVPHPSGYPWMRTLGLIARPLGALGLSPALAAALPCALAGVVGWVWLALSIQRLCTFTVGLWGVPFVACAQVVVLHSCDSEVWGPLVLVSAAMTHRLLHRPGRPLGAGVVFGIGLSHHLTCLWLAPMALAAAWPHERGPRALLRAASLGLTGTLVGLIPYATLALGEGDGWRWGDTRHLVGLLHHVLRRDYGMWSLSLHDADPAATAQWARLGASWAKAWTAGLTETPWLGLPLVAATALAGLLAWPRAGRRSAWALTGSLLLAGPLFALMQDIDPASPFARWILERFDILPLTLAVPILAIALESRLGTSAARRPPRGLGLLFAALCVRQLFHTLTGDLPRKDDGVEVYARDLLRSPNPEGRALILGTDDHRTFGVLYAQEVLGEGRNGDGTVRVLYIDASLLAHPWYRAWLRRRWPDLPEETKPLALVGALWRQTSTATLPVYLANDFSRPSAALPRVPQGLLWRVLPPGLPPVDPAQVVQDHRAARNRWIGPPLAPLSPFSRDLAAIYADRDAQLRTALQRAGSSLRIDEPPATPSG